MHTIVMIANRGFVKSTKSHIYLTTIGWKLSKVTLVLFNANCFWTNLFKSVSEPLKKQLRKNSIGIQWVIQHRNSTGNSLKCKVYRFIQSRKKLPWIERQSYVFLYKSSNPSFPINIHVLYKYKSRLIVVELFLTINLKVFRAYISITNPILSIILHILFQRNCPIMR